MMRAPVPGEHDKWLTVVASGACAGVWGTRRAGAVFHKRTELDQQQRRSCLCWNVGPAEVPAKAQQPMISCPRPASPVVHEVFLRMRMCHVGTRRERAPS